MFGVQERLSRRQRLSAKATATVEQLEVRYLLSAGVNAPDNGVCVIDESADSSPVTITVQNGGVSGFTEITDSHFASGVPQEEPGVTSVQILIGDGNDTVTISATTLSATTDTSGTANAINAGNGNDTITGSIGRDLIITGSGASSIQGVGGDDTIQTADGADTITGGSGADNITTAGNASVTGGSGGANILSAPSGNTTIRAGNSGDFITANSGNCLLFGGAGNDSIVGITGNDTIFGMGGSDSIQSGTGVGLISLGNKGLLQFTGSTNNPVGHSFVTLGVGADTVITSGAGDTVVDGGGANVGSKLFVDNSSSDVFTHIVTHANNPNGFRNDVVTSQDTYDLNDITARDQFYLKIVVDGQDVAIPSDAGVYPNVNSVAEVIGFEPDDVTAIIKLRQSNNPAQLFYLGTFFDQWGMILRPYEIGQYITAGGHTLSVSVEHANGTVVALGGGVRGYNPQQGDTITMTYT